MQAGRAWRPFSKNVDIKLTLTSHYTKEARASNPIRDELHHKLTQWLWGVFAVKSQVSLSVVRSTEQDLDLKLMLAAAVHRRIGRARHALSSGQLDARGARPLQAGWTRAARAHCTIDFNFCSFNGTADVYSSWTHARGARPFHPHWTRAARA